MNGTIKIANGTNSSRNYNYEKSGISSVQYGPGTVMASSSSGRNRVAVEDLSKVQYGPGAAIANSSSGRNRTVVENAFASGALASNNSQLNPEDILRIKEGKVTQMSGEIVSGKGSEIDVIDAIGASGIRNKEGKAIEMSGKIVSGEGIMADASGIRYKEGKPLEMSGKIVSGKGSEIDVVDAIDASGIRYKIDNNGKYDSYVKTDDLNSIANGINKQKDKIIEAYNSKIKSAFDYSSKFLVVSGLDYNDTIKAYDDLFNSLNNQVTKLVDVLEKDIIPKYSEANQLISSMFNNEFKEQMQRALQIMKQ